MVCLRVHYCVQLLPEVIVFFFYLKVNWNQLQVNWNQLKVTWNELKVTWIQLKVNWNQLKVNWNQIKNWNQWKVTSNQLKVNWNQLKVNWNQFKINWNQLKVNWNQLKVNWKQFKINSNQLKVNWNQFKINWNQLKVNWNQFKSINFFWFYTILYPVPWFFWSYTILIFFDFFQSFPLPFPLLAKVFSFQLIYFLVSFFWNSQKWPVSQNIWCLIKTQLKNITQTIFQGGSPWATLIQNSVVWLEGTLLCPAASWGHDFFWFFQSFPLPFPLLAKVFSF